MGMKGICMVMFCLLVIGAAPKMGEGAITCTQVANYLTPCISYVANGGQVPGNCCNGIRTLWNLANNTPDRQGVCKCLKQAVAGITYSAYNLNLAAGLPAKCGVNLPYKINPSTKLLVEHKQEYVVSLASGSNSKPTPRSLPLIGNVQANLLIVVYINAELAQASRLTSLSTLMNQKM